MLKRIPWSLALLAGSVVCGFAQGGHELRVGVPGATMESVKAAVGNLGVVDRQLPDGFYHVTLKLGVDVGSAKASIRKGGVRYVFDDAFVVNGNSLTSIQRQIAYMRARNELSGSESEEGEQGVGFYDALEYYLSHRVGADGKIDKQALQEAIVQRDLLPSPPGFGGGTNNPGGVWSFVGPTNLNIPYDTYYGTPPLSGRKMCLAVSPSNPSVMYVASAGGGIWKTTDAGVNWSPCSDKWGFLHTSSVAVDPNNPNIVLAGTGDYDGFFTAQTQGIMRSTDGGATWTQVGTGTMKQECINGIMIEPTNPNIVICYSGKGTSATAGGVYRSTNGGVNWTQTYSGRWVDDMDRAIDGTYYMCTVNPSGSDGGILLKSTNQGSVWTALGTNPNVSNQSALDLACSTNAAGTLYLLSTGDEQIYKTLNATAANPTWNSIKGNFPNGYAGNTNYNWSQKTYDYWIGVMDQGAADVVLVGLIGINQDVNGDGTWVDISKTYNQSPPNYVHSDQHNFARHPTNANVAFFMCDGGLFRYTYAAAPVAANFASLNANIKDIQFYAMAAHPTDPAYVMGGAQDNSNPASRGSLASWSNLMAGDGGWGAFDKNTPGVHYTSSQFDSIFRYATATTTNAAAVYIKPNPAFNTNFIAPVVIAGTGSQLYTAGNRMYRWSGAGQVWNGVGPAALAGAGDYVNTIAVYPSNMNVMYTGSNQGYVYRTLDNWATNKRIDDANIDRAVGGIAINPTNQADVIVGMQGGKSSLGGHLWRCTNTSAATPVFTDISGTAPHNLPETAINSVAWDPYQTTTIYVATDIGVFMSTNSGTSWYNMNTLGLPNVHVNELEINSNKTYMYAATYGRGMWRIPLTSAVNPYSISGKVRTVANANYPGVTVYLKKKSTWTWTQSLNPGTGIPDNNATGISSTMAVAKTYTVAGGSLYLNITHTYIGDLEITLVGPDGQTKLVWNMEGGSADNIVKTIDFGHSFRGIKMNGNWVLKVRDLASGDTGTLNSWKLNLKYDDYGTVASKVTDASGNFSFTGLGAGMYQMFPQVTGKTWTPATRWPNLGPSVTTQDFKANQ